MTDDAFLTSFELRTLSIDEWTHHAHVRLAYIYASRHDLETATNLIRLRIKAYNEATGTPEAIDRGYHETITCAFMTLIHAAVESGGPFETFDDFCESHPELMSKSVLSRYYSRERIMSWTAKRGFVEPDRDPLPQ